MKEYRTNVSLLDCFRYFVISLIAQFIAMQAANITAAGLVALGVPKGMHLYRIALLLSEAFGLLLVTPLIAAHASS